MSFSWGVLPVYAENPGLPTPPVQDSTEPPVQTNTEVPVQDSTAVVCQDGSTSTERDTSALTGFMDALYNNLIFVGAGLALVMLMIGGYQYIGSAASPALANSGKEMITNALLGFFVLLIAYALLNFVAPDRALPGHLTITSPSLCTTPPVATPQN